MSFLRSGSIGSDGLVPPDPTEVETPAVDGVTQQLQPPLPLDTRQDDDILGTAATTTPPPPRPDLTPLLCDVARGAVPEGSARDISPLFGVPYVCEELARLLCDAALHVAEHSGDAVRTASGAVEHVVARARWLLGEDVPKECASVAVGRFLMRQLWPACLLLHAPHINPDAVGALTRLVSLFVDFSMAGETASKGGATPMETALRMLDDRSAEVVPRGTDVEGALRSSRRRLLGVSGWVPPPEECRGDGANERAEAVRRHLGNRLGDLSILDVPPCARRAAILGDQHHYKNEDRMTVPNFYADAGFDIEDIGDMLSKKLEAVQARIGTSTPKRTAAVRHTLSRYRDAAQRKVDAGFTRRPLVSPGCTFYARKMASDPASASRRKFHCPFAIAASEVSDGGSPVGEADAAKRLREEAALQMNPSEALRIARSDGAQMACVAEWRAATRDVAPVAEEMSTRIYHPTDYMVNRAEAHRIHHNK